MPRWVESDECPSSEPEDITCKMCGSTVGLRPTQPYPTNVATSATACAAIWRTLGWVGVTHGWRCRGNRWQSSSNSSRRIHRHRLVGGPRPPCRELRLRLGALPRRGRRPRFCSSQWRSRPASQVAARQAEESGGQGRSVSGAWWTGMRGREWQWQHECRRGRQGRIKNSRRSERIRQDCYRARRTGDLPDPRSDVLSCLGQIKWFKI